MHHSRRVSVSLFMYIFFTRFVISLAFFSSLPFITLAIIIRVYPRLSYILPSFLVPFFLISTLVFHLSFYFSFLLALPLFIPLSLTYRPPSLPPKGAVTLVRISFDIAKEKQFGDETRGGQTLYTP